MNESDVDLFAADDTEHFQTEWHAVQAGFVDDPEAAVRDADKLVEQVMDTVATKLAQRRDALSTGASNGDGQRTEQLRVALRRYRSVFRQLTGLSATDNGHHEQATARAGALTANEPEVADRFATPTVDEPMTVDGPMMDDESARPTDHGRLAAPTSDAAPMADDKFATPTSDDTVAASTGDEPLAASTGDELSAASEPAVEGAVEFVEHRADLPDAD